MTIADEFLAGLSQGLRTDERLILCGFGGDPNQVDTHHWKPRPWKPGLDLMHDCGILPKWNAYTTCASFVRAEDHSFRRRGACFAAGLALLVDDVGTGLGSKVDPSIVAGIEPSAAIETSPDNYQYWYFLDEPCRDKALFDSVIRAFIAGKLAGEDPGMSGVTRVGRIPGYLNTKEKYGGNFQVVWNAFDPTRRFSIPALVSAFGLELRGQQRVFNRTPSGEALERNRAFLSVFKFLHQHGMLKRDEPDRGGWVEITCPFVDCHTGRADTGAAIAEPSEQNGYYGGFRCHHGNCLGKGWHELTDWINEISLEELNQAALN